MKLPQIPPDIHHYLTSETSLDSISKIFSSGFGPYDGKGRYLHWDKLRHLPPPDGYDSQLYWFAIRQGRSVISKNLPFRNKTGEPFVFCMPDGVVRDLLWIEKHTTGSITADEKITDENTKQTYLIGSLIEEAISSSQLEGASTTRRQAKDMLQSGRAPRDHSEKMIRNNHLAMQFIREYRDMNLSPTLIFELHEILTRDTLGTDDQDKAGAFRTEADDICVYSKDDTLLHVPPRASELEQRLQALCDFVNHQQSEDDKDFIPTVIRAIVAHFMIGYDHPFVDGNGRTARAIFYWIMAKEHYWLMEYISISRVIKKAPSRYMQAFLYTETDGNDITYFIVHQLDVIRHAVADLYEYLAQKSQRLKETANLVSCFRYVLNHRQLALLQHALRHPGMEYTIKSHQRSHGVSYQTARTDLLNLSDDMGFLRKTKIGKTDIFIAPANLEASIKEMEL